MSASPRSPTWVPVAGVAAGACLAAAGLWWMNVRSLDEQIRRTRADVKKLTVGKQLPPSEQVMAYLTQRHQALEWRYQQRADLVALAPSAAASSSDPQLFYQEQFHELQRTLERLAAAKSLSTPELLGFPKEVPPPETVPRFLAQVGLIREASALIIEQELGTVISAKVEDPETILNDDGTATFLVRAPVRLRYSGSLSQLMGLLGTLGRSRPLVDLQALRVTGGAAASDILDVELRLARYLAVNTPAATTAPPPEGRSPARTGTNRRRPASEAQTP